MKKAILYFLLFSSSFLRAQFYELGLGGSGTLFHGDVGAVGTNGLWILTQPTGGSNHFTPSIQLALEHANELLPRLCWRIRRLGEG